MRGLAAVLLILTAGCVTPGASVDPAALVGLDAIKLDGATSARLPNGDMVLTLTADIVGSEEFEVDIPEGVTFVEAVVASDDFPSSVILRDAETRAAMCYTQTWTGWGNVRSDGARCSAVAATSPGRTWVVGVNAALVTRAGLPLIGGEAEPVPVELTLTFSTQPLDGPSAAIKLDALSKPIFEPLEMEVIDVPASADGVGLHVEITRPKTDEKVPVMLRASPYNGPEQNAYGRSDPAFVDHWVSHGYATAVMDLRGTGKSDGCFSMRSALDQTDIADVVEFLGAQDWSNGKVGMHGVSYEGFTPAAAAVQQPEHLAAILIVAPAVDTWSNYLPGGVDTGRSFSTVTGYMTGNAALTPADEMPPDSILHTADAFCDPTIVPMANDPRHLYDAFYAERNLTERAADIEVPVMLEQGFWDNNVKANFIPDFFNALTVEKRALFGSWQHIVALRADEGVRALAWFDHWLKGIDTGILDTPVVEVLTNDRQWRAADVWPPSDATTYDIEIKPADFLAMPPAIEGAVPAPYVISTRTEPLATDVYLSGVGLLELQVGLINGGSAQLEARLFEVKGDEETFVGVGWMNLAHRNGHETFAPLAPGETTDITLKMLPQDHVLKKGSELRIEIRAVTERWGGPESGTGAAPSVVSVKSGTMRLPSLPTSILSPAPRSAS